MVQPLVGEDGHVVQVLETSDLDHAKNSLIRWLIFTVVPLALALGVYATRLDARNERQDEVMIRNTERIGELRTTVERNAVVKEQVDSMRIEMRHLTEAVQQMNRTVARVAR